MAAPDNPATTLDRMTNETLAYSVDGAARVIGISERGVWRLIHSKELATWPRSSIVNRADEPLSHLGKQRSRSACETETLGYLLGWVSRTRAKAQ